MKKYKLKIIIILIVTAFLFSCSKEIKEQKPVEAKGEIPAKTELPPAETQAKEEKTEKKEEVAAENSDKEAEKEGLKYLSDEKHYMAKGSLLFYNLNINDTYEQALAKLKEFGVNGLFPTAMMPKSLQEMGCKAYIPDYKTLGKDASNDFYIIFKDDKIIRFIKFFAYDIGFYKFYLPNSKRVAFDALDLKKSSGKGYTYYETPDYDSYTKENNVIYRSEVYYPTDATTIIMTRDGYKPYFEEADRKSDDILELGDLYFYGLHIKDDMETVKTKLDSHDIIYKKVFFEPKMYLFDDVLDAEFKYGLDGVESTDEKVTVWNYNDKVIYLRVYPTDEDTYILMHCFQRKYKVFEGHGSPTWYGTKMGRYKYHVRLMSGSDFMFEMSDESVYYYY